MKSNLRKIAADKLFRVLDANYNRLREGLRVCEDICRFSLDRDENTRQYKSIRHCLTAIFSSSLFDDMILSRDILKDVGRRSIPSESKRQDVRDVYCANSQRVKESLRVLEEFLKILDPGKAEALKKIRYRVYEVERKVFREMRVRR